MANREQRSSREKKKPKKGKEQKKPATAQSFSTQPGFGQPQNNAGQWQKGKK
jgi:hypothetical protein